MKKWKNIIIENDLTAISKFLIEFKIIYLDFKNSLDNWYLKESHYY